MNAIPAFDGPAGEFVDELPLGTKVYCFWGAMFPTEHGVVIDKDVHRQFQILWSSGEESWHRVRLTRSVNGSPIGVFQE